MHLIYWRLLYVLVTGMVIGWDVYGLSLNVRTLIHWIFSTYCLLSSMLVHCTTGGYDLYKNSTMFFALLLYFCVFCKAVLLAKLMLCKLITYVGVRIDVGFETILSDLVEVLPSKRFSNNYKLYGSLLSFVLWICLNNSAFYYWWFTSCKL